jgi:hypothetical protein
METQMNAQADQKVGSGQQKLKALVASLATADAESPAAAAVKERYSVEQGPFTLSGLDDLADLSIDAAASKFRDTLARCSK